MNIRKRTFIAMTAASAIAAALLYGTSQLSTQQALNILAGNLTAPYTRYSTQQAANLLVDLSQVPTENDTLVSCVCLVMDDNVKRGSGSAGTYENMDTMRAAMFSCVKAADGVTTYSTGTAGPRVTKWVFPVSFTIEPESAINPAQAASDTATTSATNSNFSIYDYQNFVTRYGCDVSGTTGYDEQGGWASGNSSGTGGTFVPAGRIARGNFTSYNQFYNNTYRGIKPSMIDSLQFGGLLPTGRFRWMSWSNSSCTGPQKAILARLGIEYGISSGGLAASGSSSGERPNYLWPITAGVNMGLGNAGNALVSCMPFAVPDRYEIPQTLAETNDTSATMKAIRKCVALRGSGIVINLHNLALWSSNLTGSSSTPVGVFANPSTVSGVMATLAKYQRQGRIRFVTAAEFCDHYYKKSIGPGANVLPKNFADCDGDGNVDLYVQSGGSNSFPGGAIAVPRAGTGVLKLMTAGTGYGGKREARLRWGGVQAIGDTTTAMTGVTYDITFGSARSKPWTSGALAIAYPCPPKGWIAHIEFAAREDTTRGAIAEAILGDSIGVSWTAAALTNWNKRAQGLSGLQVYVPGVSGNYYPWQSWNGAADAVPQPFIKFAGIDRVHGTVANGATDHKFMRAEFEYKVPDWCDVLYVNIWKGGKIDPNRVRISDVSLSFYPPNPVDN